MKYVYKRKETKATVDEDMIQLAREQIIVLRYMMDEAKRECALRLKQLRKELIATKMWVRRNGKTAKVELQDPFSSN